MANLMSHMGVPIAIGAVAVVCCSVSLTWCAVAQRIDHSNWCDCASCCNSSPSSLSCSRSGWWRN